MSKNNTKYGDFFSPERDTIEKLGGEFKKQRDEKELPYDRTLRITHYTIRHDRKNRTTDKTSRVAKE